MSRTTGTPPHLSSPLPCIGLLNLGQWTMETGPNNKTTSRHNLFIVAPPTRPLLRLTCLFPSQLNTDTGPYLTCNRPVYSLRFFRGFLSKRVVLLLCYSLKMVRVPNSILNHSNWVNSSMPYADLHTASWSVSWSTNQPEAIFTPNMTLITFMDSPESPLMWWTLLQQDFSISQSPMMIYCPRRHPRHQVHTTKKSEKSHSTTS